MTKRNVRTSKRSNVQRDVRQGLPGYGDRPSASGGKTKPCPTRSGEAFQRSNVSTFGRFDDFAADPVSIAKRLLGQRLVRVLDGERLSGRIVETEAYLGVEDRAAHTFNGRRTKRNESMYLPGGHAYIYFTYGMHYCFNVVCGKADDGVAVLIRALEPEEGIEAMHRNRSVPRRSAPRLTTRSVAVPTSTTRSVAVPTSTTRSVAVPTSTTRTVVVPGPKALAITDLCSGPAKLTQALRVDRELDGADLRTSPLLFIERTRLRCIPANRIVTTPRIGVSYAGECAERPLRFFLGGSLHVSY